MSKLTTHVMFRRDLKAVFINVAIIDISFTTSEHRGVMKVSLQLKVYSYTMFDTIYEPVVRL